MISLVHHVGHGLLGQIGNGIHGGQLHVLVDGTGMSIERSAEYIGEPDDVVYLVRIVGTSRGNQHVGTRGLGIFVGNLRRGIGQCEDDGFLGHAAYHVLRQHIALRKTQEHIGSPDGFGQRMHIAAVGGKEFLVLRQVLAVGSNHSLAVEHHDVFLARTQTDIQLRTGYGRSAGAVDHDAHVLNALACHFKGIEQTGRRDDGRAVLVVMHHGDVKFFLQPAFYLETLRSLDVFQIDAAKRGRNGFHGLNKLVGVFLVDLDVEHVDACINLKQQPFAFHHGLAAHGTDIAQSEHGRAVGNDGHQIALVGIIVCLVRIFFYLEARLGHAGRIGQRQVGLRTVRLCGNHLYLTRPSL